VASFFLIKLFKTFKVFKPFKPSPSFDEAQDRLSSPASRGRMKEGDQNVGSLFAAMHGTFHQAGDARD
jgi:hypothetical protein